jgi:large subunit ribosomal protein L35
VRSHSHKRHILTKKSSKRKRRLRKPAIVGPADKSRLEQMLTNL